MTNYQGETFGEWLLAQRGCEGIVGQLVEGAEVDRGFPRLGSPDDVRQHFSIMEADRGWFRAVDDAETDWLSY